MVSIETSHDAFTAIETFYSLLQELNKLQNLTSGCQVLYKFFDWQLSLFKTWSVWIKRRTVQLNEKLDKKKNSPVQRKPLPKNAKQNCRPVEVLCSSSLYYSLSQCLSDFKSLIEEWGLLEREGLFHVKAPGNSFVTLEWYYWKQKHALLMLKSL